MTPFGRHIRHLRAKKGVTQKQMARDMGVSAAWLSALEHGKRGQPSWDFQQRIIQYFNIIWDEADELTDLVRISHPRIVVDTSGLCPEATEFANLVAERIDIIDPGDLNDLIHQIKIRSNARPRRKRKIS
ncbi:MAG: helix-turn-helix domain-containing protein [Rhizobiaceae bacterium]